MNKVIFYFRWICYKLVQYYKLEGLSLLVRDIRRRMHHKLVRRFPGYRPETLNSKKNSKINPKLLYKYEKHIYAQHGEDGVTLFILSLIPHKKSFVELGVEDGTECNCRILKESGYSGIMIDLNGDGKKVYREYISRENINSIFKKYNVPYYSGILSIDIDGNDFWVWEVLSNDYKFDLVIIEYNSSLGFKESLVIPYKDDYKWDGSDYFGASLKALEKLGKEKGYMLIYADMTGTNLYFLNSKHSSLVEKKFTINDIYQPPYYGLTNTGHPHDLLEREYLIY